MQMIILAMEMRFCIECVEKSPFIQIWILLVVNFGLSVDLIQLQ